MPNAERVEPPPANGSHDRVPRVLQSSHKGVLLFFPGQYLEGGEGADLEK